MFKNFLKRSPQKSSSTAEVLEIAGHQIQIRRRAYQRSLNLHVRNNGQVLITCGRRVSERLLHQFVHEKQEWLQRSLKEIAELRANYPSKTYQNGETFTFLGQSFQLQFKEARGRPKVKLSSPHLCFSASPDHYGPAEVKKALHDFYKRQGRQVLTHRLQYWSKAMDLHPQKITFRQAKTRWGSCSSQGTISLNWRLIVFPLPVIDYVVIHELAHLKHLNHSKEFWQLVETFSPQYKQHKRWLREHSLLADF